MAVGGFKKKRVSPSHSRQSLLVKGRAVYEGNCYFCHGYRGDAQTVAAETLSPPPLNFWRADDLTPARVEKAVRYGRAGTAMQSFTDRLSDDDIAAVAIYVASGLSGGAAYHTAANGWPDHERRNGAAYAFVRGEILIDAPAQTLTDEQKQGLALFRSTCATCHNGFYEKSSREIFQPAAAIGEAAGAEPVLIDRVVEEKAGRESKSEDKEVKDENSQIRTQPRPHRWRRPRPKRRGGDCSRCHDDLDSTGNKLGEYGEYGEYGEPEEGEEHDENGGYGPGPHDVIPDIKTLTDLQARGRELYQTSCAFCHAADGTGRNWIGRFLTDSPPDMTGEEFAKSYERGRFIKSVLTAPTDTSMPSFARALSREEVDAIARYVERAFIENAEKR